MKGYGKSRYYADKAFFVDRQAAGATLQKRWPQMRDDFSLVLEREKAGPHWLALGGLIDGKVIMPYTDGEKWWKTWSLMMIEHTLVKKGLGRDADLMAMVDGNGSADLHARAKAYAGQGKHSIWGLQAICLFQEDPEGDGELPRDGEHDDEIDEGNAKLGNLRAFYGKSAMVLLGKPGVVDKKLRTLLSGGWMQDKTWGISDFKVESLAHLPQRSVREKKQKDANCERADYSTLTFWTAEVMRRGDEMLEALFGGTQYEGKITYADLSDQWKQEDKQKWDEQLTPEERSKLRLGGSKLLKITWKKILARAKSVTVHDERFKSTYVAALHGGEYVRGLQQAKADTGAVQAPVAPRQKAPGVQQQPKKKGGGKDDVVDKKGGGSSYTEDVLAKMKTQTCFKWEKTGDCKYGDRCRFKHGVQFAIEPKEEGSWRNKKAPAGGRHGASPTLGELMAAQVAFKKKQVAARKAQNATPEWAYDDGQDRGAIQCHKAMFKRQKQGRCGRCGDENHTWEECKKFTMPLRNEMAARNLGGIF